MPNTQNLRRRIRCRHKIWTTTKCEYVLSVHKSNQYMYLQLDHVPTKRTVISVSSKVVSPKKLNVAIATTFGKTFVEKVKEKFPNGELPQVAFNRGGYMYHGKIKAAADAARENGMRF